LRVEEVRHLILEFDEKNHITIIIQVGNIEFFTLAAV
jgi:hypothetical protein